MKIVMIGPFAFTPKGTVSARAYPMARALVKRGHQVTILMPPYDHPEDSGRNWEMGGVRLENVPASTNGLRNQLVVPPNLALRAVRLGPGIVHVFKPVGYSGLSAQYLRASLRLPVVVDTDDWEGRGGWADANPYPPSWKRFFAWQEQWLLRHAPAVTVASRALETLAWGLGVAPARVVYLPNGPDPALRDRPCPSEAQRSAIRARLGVGEAPTALYLGHIPHGSDLDLAITAMTLVVRDMPNARLVIAGSGSGQSQLQSAARAAGVAESVVFPGWIEHDQAPLYVGAVDAIVNPYRDTLINRAKCAGKIVLGMALGKAVVTTRLGENLEYVQDGKTGLLVEPGDVPGLAHALVRVLSDKSLAEVLGRNAYERIWQHYDWDVQAGEVERAYGIALAGAGSRV